MNQDRAPHCLYSACYWLGPHTTFLVPPVQDQVPHNQIRALFKLSRAYTAGSGPRPASALPHAAGSGPALPLAAPCMPRSTSACPCSRLSRWQDSPWLHSHHLLQPNPYRGRARSGCRLDAQGALPQGQRAGAFPSVESWSQAGDRVRARSSSPRREAGCLHWCLCRDLHASRTLGVIPLPLNHPLGETGNRAGSERDPTQPVLTAEEDSCPPRAAAWP